jgi:hypothetical protein
VTGGEGYAARSRNAEVAEVPDDGALVSAPDSEWVAGVAVQVETHAIYSHRGSALDGCGAEPYSHTKKVARGHKARWRHDQSEIGGELIRILN